MNEEKRIQVYTSAGDEILFSIPASSLNSFFAGICTTFDSEVDMLYSKEDAYDSEEEWTFERASRESLRSALISINTQVELLYALVSTVVKNKRKPFLLGSETAHLITTALYLAQEMRHSFFLKEKKECGTDIDLNRLTNWTDKSEEFINIMKQK